MSKPEIFAVIFVVFVVGILSYTLIKQISEVQKEQENSSKNAISSTLYEDGKLVTVKHDNHLFIVEARCQKGAILHHPDCPCKK